MNRATTALLGALAVFGASANPSLAQQSDGARWTAWTGCWDGSAEIGDAGDDAATFLVCVEATTPQAAELSTYQEGEIVALETVATDGQSRPFEEGGCEGERVASWSEDGSRLFLSSTTDCGGGVMRRSTGVLAMLPRGAGWVEVQSVDVGEQSPVVGIRSFRPASEARVSEQGALDASVGREVAVGTARTQAGSPLSPADIVELVDVAGPAVTSALIVERGERFGLDAETLTALAGRGVPAEVVDVMVAMSYPERFAITGGGGDVEPAPRDVAVPLADRRSRTSAYGGYSPWAFGFDLFWDPYWSSRYRLGYSWGYPFGYGYGYGYGYDPFGYRYGYAGYASPRVIFIDSPRVVDRGARLSRETGVVPSGGGGSSSSRSTISRTRGASSSPAPPPSSPPRATSSGGDSGGSGGGNVRRARPRD